MPNDRVKDALVNLCRVIDRIEVIEGVDDLGQLAIGCDLTAQLLTARNEALKILRSDASKVKKVLSNKNKELILNEIGVDIDDKWDKVLTEIGKINNGTKYPEPNMEKYKLGED